MDVGADVESAEPCNEDLAREAGLHFSDLSKVERDMLLRARAAGIPAYDSGPLAAPSESEASLSTEGEASQPSEDVGEEFHSRLIPQVKFLRACLGGGGYCFKCECGHCVVLDNFSEEECRCCREMGEPVTAAQPEGCITEHPEFHLLSLNIAVLRVAYFELRARRDCMDEDIHKRYRYTAYRQFVRWLWGHLSRGHRFILPSCVVAKIRGTFPTETPTRFKYPEY
ncbi:P2X purinoceptor 7-like [Rhipicephalus sanguineus]|uniref:P2X purinoceptor 7-like n=1 Tax=Rhipicephalus sanguineus TaxID=34632 RepID=UPI0020C382CF|nr:P2X purinoceptor 7-like [Rhipicephalus sanguineus]